MVKAPPTRVRPSSLAKTPSRLPKPPPRVPKVTDTSRLRRTSELVHLSTRNAPASRGNASSTANIVTGWDNTDSSTGAETTPHSRQLTKTGTRLGCSKPVTQVERQPAKTNNPREPRSRTPSPQKKPQRVGDTPLTPQTAHLRYLEEHPELAFAAGSNRLMNSPEIKQEPVCLSVKNILSAGLSEWCSSETLRLAFWFFCRQRS